MATRAVTEECVSENAIISENVLVGDANSVVGDSVNVAGAAQQASVIAAETASTSAMQGAAAAATETLSGVAESPVPKVQEDERTALLAEAKRLDGELCSTRSLLLEKAEDGKEISFEKYEEYLDELRQIRNLVVYWKTTEAADRLKALWEAVGKVLPSLCLMNVKELL